MTEPLGDDPDTGDDTAFEQLDVVDTLDDPRVNPHDPLDEGYSPGERPRGMDAWGVTESEEREGEPLAERLSHEVPDVGAREYGDDADGGLDRDGLGSDGPGSDGPGDVVDTDGELRDGEVGDARSGRLATDDDGSGYSTDEWASDVGIDGAGASAEEAAVHLIPDDTAETDETGDIDD